mmetsp:Transcript_11609/g.24616  ORF Transcript_11609/g.24616 Transcript_11609/m.24616 type:complete len:426 (-) Transcript_11609:381-1658(-)
MDIDENNVKPKTTSSATKVPKKTVVTPSASAETSSAHPSMSLAQEIHRLTMFHNGKLTASDASGIMGMDPTDLMEKVMNRVGCGEKGVEAALKENEEKLKSAEEGEKKKGQDKKTADGKSDDATKDEEEKEEEPLLNPSLYRHLQSTLSYTSPSALSEENLDALSAHNSASIATLRSRITEAKDEAGDMEVLHAHMDLARYCARCCTKEEALEAYDEVLALPKLSVGKKLDACLEMARVCSFWGDWRKMKDTLEKAAKVIAKGGDWDRRNRLKVYQALSFLLVRDLQSASKLLVDGIATFSCTELCDYAEFITYAILTNLLYLPRTELKKNIIDGSEILQVSKEIPVVVSDGSSVVSISRSIFLTFDQTNLLNRSNWPTPFTTATTNNSFTPLSSSNPTLLPIVTFNLMLDTSFVNFMYSHSNSS